jgi:hypothetical protein
MKVAPHRVTISHRYQSSPRGRCTHCGMGKPEWRPVACYRRCPAQAKSKGGGSTGRRRPTSICCGHRRTSRGLLDSCPSQRSNHRCLRAPAMRQPVAPSFLARQPRPWRALNSGVCSLRGIFGFLGDQGAVSSLGVDDAVLAAACRAEDPHAEVAGQGAGHVVAAGQERLVDGVVAGLDPPRDRGGDRPRRPAASGSDSSPHRAGRGPPGRDGCGCLDGRASTLDTDAVPAPGWVVARGAFTVTELLFKRR